MYIEKHVCIRLKPIVTAKWAHIDAVHVETRSAIRFESADILPAGVSVI